MKKVKLIMGLLIFLIVFIFIGETYSWHIDSFETEYDYVTMYKNPKITQSEMLDDIVRIAAEENVEVFTVERKIENIFSVHLKIYGTNKVKKYLLDNSNVKPGVLNSIFLGQIKVNNLSFEKIPDVNKIEAYYLIGEKKDILHFKQKTVDKYAGKFPQEGYVSLNSELYIAVVWVVALCLLLLINLYEVIKMKKEVFVRIVSGERIQKIIVNNILIDLIIYLSLFIGVVLFLSYFTEVDYLISISIISVVTFLVLNSLIYLSLFLIDYKKDMSGKTGVKRILNLSYVYKVCTVFITVLILSSSIALIGESMSFYKQKSYFEKHNKYSYVEISVDDFDQTKLLRFNNYIENLSEKKAISLVDLSTGQVNSKINYLFADTGAIEYLKNYITYIKNNSLDDKVYFFLPEKYSDEKDKNETQKLWDSYYPHMYEFETIIYQEDIDVISIEKEFNINSSLQRNPIIILNNMKALDIDMFWNDYIFRTSFFLITENEWKHFLENNNLESEIAYKTNVYENYLYKWNFLKRSLLIGIILSFILLILEATIIRTIINQEYNLNAVEIALKKVNGYSIFSRYKTLFFSTIGSALVGVGITLIANYYLDFAAFLTIFIAGCFVIIIELFIISTQLKKSETKNIQAILKGSSL